MGKTSIQWTDHSINPIRARDKATGAVGHHCEKISSGCAHCYAAELQKRFQMPAFGGVKTELPENIEIFLDQSKLKAVMKRRKPTKYFWCDMTDMFGWWVKDEWIDMCFAAMAHACWHTHQILTKRPERALEYFQKHNPHLAMTRCFNNFLDYTEPVGPWPLPNVWMGVSVENRKALERVMVLREIPAAVRFLSIEPLIEDLGQIRGYLEQGIDWVIIGGESGRSARPCNLEWIRSILDQCQAAGVACFIKQLGKKCRDEYVVHSVNPKVEWSRFLPLKDSHGGDWDEWPEDLRVREFPKSACALTGG
jgi:protein gp37